MKSKFKPEDKAGRAQTGRVIQEDRDALPGRLGLEWILTEPMAQFPLHPIVQNQLELSVVLKKLDEKKQFRANVGQVSHMPRT